MLIIVRLAKPTLDVQTQLDVVLQICNDGISTNNEFPEVVALMLVFFICIFVVCLCVRVESYKFAVSRRNT